MSLTKATGECRYFSFPVDAKGMNTSEMPVRSSLSIVCKCQKSPAREGAQRSFGGFGVVVVEAKNEAR